MCHGVVWKVPQHVRQGYMSESDADDLSKQPNTVTFSMTQVYFFTFRNSCRYLPVCYPKYTSLRTTQLTSSRSGILDLASWVNKGASLCMQFSTIFPTRWINCFTWSVSTTFASALTTSKSGLSLSGRGRSLSQRLKLFYCFLYVYSHASPCTH